MPPHADVADANWSFNCVEDGTFNALCLPGGIVFVNSGVLKYSDNDDQLAGVIGHEIGHALARHGVEQLGRQRLTSVAIGVISVAVGTAAKDPNAARDMAEGLSNGAYYALFLPGSREQEYEADKLGLTLMARAGYDPAQFIALWEKLINKEILQNKNDFTKTHPADAKRLAAMRDYLPQARQAAADSRPQAAPGSRTGDAKQPGATPPPADRSPSQTAAPEAAPAPSTALCPSTVSTPTVPPNHPAAQGQAVEANQPGPATPGAPPSSAAGPANATEGAQSLNAKAGSPAVGNNQPGKTEPSGYEAGGFDAGPAASEPREAQPRQSSRPRQDFDSLQNPAGAGPAPASGKP